MKSLRSHLESATLLRIFTIALAVTWLQFATGCVSSQLQKAEAELEARLLEAHSAQDLRVSAEPQEGLVPTGVWRVRGERNVVYLAATTHLVSSNQVPFPSSFYAAYQDSSEIYMEVDDRQSRVSEMSITMKMVKWMRQNQAEFYYPKGQTLANDLSPETLDRLKQFYGPDFPRVANMRPPFLVFFLQAQGMGKQFLEEGGVEDVFAALARRDRKPIRELDDGSVNQLVLLALDEMIYEIKREIQKSGADAVVNETLSGTSEPVDERSWRSGDLEAAQAEMNEMRSQAPELYEKIGPERNRKWLPKIISALKSNKNTVVLAGVAHFPGPDGLIALLEREGYKVEPLYGADPKR